MQELRRALTLCFLIFTFLLLPSSNIDAFQIFGLKTYSTTFRHDLMIFHQSIAADSPSSFKKSKPQIENDDRIQEEEEEEEEEKKKKVSKRLALLDKLGIYRGKRPFMKSQSRVFKKREKQKKQKREIKTVQELEDYFNDKEEKFKSSKGEIDYDVLLNSLSVQGDTQIIGSQNHLDVVHPVAQVLHERRRKNSKPGVRDDNFTIALSVEGGGMRGCVTAGMVAAIYYLGLEDCFDSVYGASAGTVIGAYFITRQFPWFGPEIYYDILTTAGSSFIDAKRMLRAIGFGLLDPRLIKDVITRRNNGKPALNLDFLLEWTVQHRKPLNWTKFQDMQSVQPLKLVTSGLKSEESITLDMEKGSFKTLEELSKCMHASCLLPGIAGPIINMDIREQNLHNASSVAQLQLDEEVERFLLGNDIDTSFREPLTDALVYEPLPFRSAVKEGATHIVVLRSRPDGVDVSGKSKMYERLIMRRFFRQKNKLPNIYKYMRQHKHKKLYAHDIIVLNEAANDINRKYDDLTDPHLMPIAIEPGLPEVSRLETRRDEIFEGVRRGFARAYDSFVEDPNERGNGAAIAKLFFPDDILNYDPLEVNARNEQESFLSAYELYLKMKKEKNKDNQDGEESSYGKTAVELGLPQ